MLNTGVYKQKLNGHLLSYSMYSSGVIQFYIYPTLNLSTQTYPNHKKQTDTLNSTHENLYIETAKFSAIDVNGIFSVKFRKYTETALIFLKVQ